MRIQEIKMFNRESQKKIMTGAGISSIGVALCLFLAALDIIDIEFASAVSVAVLTAIVNGIYVFAKGPKTASE